MIYEYLPTSTVTLLLTTQGPPTVLLATYHMPVLATYQLVRK
jgi:hypothetical protein